MKSWTKHVLGIAVVAFFSFAMISLSCGKRQVVGTADTAYAESAPKENIVPAESLRVVEALQNSFRAISAGVLPAVVEVDVVETKTITQSDPFEEFRRYFGIPGFGDSDSGNKNGKKREYESKGLGSGVIVRKAGDVYYVLTNNHVAGSATKISVKLNDGREFEGKLVGADARMDIALVSFESKDNTIKLAALGDSDAVQTGDICLAMGAPLGYRQSVTQGIVSAKGRSGTGIGNINDFIQTDAAINQGNSGGPLLNIYGEVIGINTWIVSQSGGSQGLGFSIPINNIKNSIDSFITKGKIVYGWLGVALTEVDKEYKEALGIGDSNGALVSQLFMNSPASRGGIKAGDFITSVNGVKVESVEQVQREVGRLEAGKTVPFEIMRNGKKQSLSVKVEERDEKVSSDNGKLWPGFFARPISEEVKKQFEIGEKTEGVVIVSVMEKSPAASLRLQAGDVITAVNGKKVSNIKEFYEEVAKIESSVNFDIFSNGGTITTGTFKF